MAILNIEDFSGLDTRTKKNKKSVNASSDLLNVQLNAHGDIEKRNGTLVFDSITNVRQALNYGTQDILMLYQETTVESRLRAKVSMVGGSAPVPLLGGEIVVNSNFLFSNCQYDNIMYLADTTEKTDMLKYDGGGIYKAGIPKPFCEFNSTATATKYFRVFFAFTDSQGKTHMGDYYQTPDLTSIEAGKPLSIRNNEFGTYSRVCVAAETTQLNTQYPTLLVESSCNMDIGQRVLFLTDIDKRKVFLEITSIVDNGTDKTITFINRDFNNLTDDVQVTTGDLIGPTWKIYVFESLDATTGYTYSGSKEYQLEYATPVAFSDTDLSPDSNFYLEDIYDPQLIKGMPPKCKYIDIHNNVMVAAGSFIPGDQYNKMYWSDLSVGSTVETFAPLDYEPVGVTSEGEITGIISYFGRIAVTKLDSVYIINGVLTGRNFSIKNYFNNQVGCVNHFTLSKYANGFVFLSRRGVFGISGMQLKEISDIIQPEFDYVSSLDSFYGFNMIIDPSNERIVLNIQNVVYVYDLYHKAWYKWNNLPVDGFSTFRRNGFSGILYVDHIGNRVLKENPLKNDVGEAIESYYATSWIDNNQPDLRKKYTEMVLKSFYGDEINLEIETQYDWTEDNISTSIEKSMTNPIQNINLDNELCYSMRFIVKNNTLNEDMRLSGISIEIEPVQMQTKVR